MFLLRDSMFCSLRRRTQGEFGALLVFVNWAVFSLYKVLVGSVLPTYSAVVL